MIDSGDQYVAHHTVETGHGRHVEQQVRTIQAADRVDLAAWPACRTIGEVNSLL